jgi:beta-glucosidase
MSFPKGFVWGTATASYQIEGAAAEDGRKPSTWDMMARRKGAIYEGHTGDVACDHYHRYKEDIALMKNLGTNAYRFSVAWPRVIPDGVGRVNEKGLEFYDRLVDELLAAGIEPWATLYHWDHPLDLYHKGGWLNPETPKWFADYSQVVVDKIGDRVGHWFTLNEPQCFIGLGLQTGVHAPGDKLPWAEVLLAAHHALIAHGLASQVIRASAKKKPLIGYAPVGSVAMPASESPEDIEAARSYMFSVREENPWQNAWWMDPVLFGKYPEDGLECYGRNAPKFTDEDMKTIAQPVDFFGANIYQGVYVKSVEGMPVVQTMPAGWPQTAFRWWVTQECLYWGPKFYYERYKKPIVISENGLSNQDWIHLDGKVHDPQRIDYLTRHLLQLRRAADDGVDVQGYFQWSLLDNFEWAEGYKERFGLVYVDYQTLERTPKDSFDWYREVIATNGDNLCCKPR